MTLVIRYHKLYKAHLFVKPPFDLHNNIHPIVFFKNIQNSSPGNLPGGDGKLDKTTKTSMGMRG